MLKSGQLYNNYLFAPAGMHGVIIIITKTAKATPKPNEINVSRDKK